jgi:hypothetical protein
MGEGGLVGIGFLSGEVMVEQQVVGHVLNQRAAPVAVAGVVERQCGLDGVDDGVAAGDQVAIPANGRRRNPLITASVRR